MSMPMRVTLVPDILPGSNRSAANAPTASTGLETMILDNARLYVSE